MAILMLLLLVVLTGCAALRIPGTGTTIGGAGK
jgi:hypothetical protein